MENQQFEEERFFFINLVETLLSQKMLPEAIALAEERLAVFPADIDARIFINLALIKMERIEEARNLLDKLEKDLVRLSFGYLRIAEACRERGLNQDAVLYYQKFLSLNPFAENNYEIAEIIALLQKDLIPANEEDESGRFDMPSAELYTITLADLYFNQGHPQMAADILAQILKKDPANVQASLKFATMQAVLAQESSSGKIIMSNDSLIKTLSSWLTGISRLKKNAA